MEFLPHVYLDHRGNFVYAPRQWESRLQCNVVSHWLSAFTEWSFGHSDHGNGLWCDKYISGCHRLCLYFLLLRKGLLRTFRVRKREDGFGLYKQATISWNVLWHPQNQQAFLWIVFIVSRRSCKQNLWDWNSVLVNTSHGSYDIKKSLTRYWTYVCECKIW